MPLTPSTSHPHATGAAALLLLVALSLGGCATGPPAARFASLPPANRYDFAHDAFGRTFRLTVYADGPARAEEAAAAARGRLDDLSAKLDAARPDSEISRLCDAAGGPWVKVGDELILLLQQARKLSKTAEGATDVTAPPAAALWREAFDAGRLPPDAALHDVRAVVGWTNVQVDAIERRARLLLPGVRIDLGQCAAAYAVDRALGEVRRHGVSSAVIDTGDIIAAAAPPPGRTGWPVTLPPASAKAKPHPAELRDAAVVRGGDDVRVKAIAGRRYASAVDPRTALGVRPTQHGPFPTAVTVTAAKAFPAAQAASVVTALGPDRSALFIRIYRNVTVAFRRPTNQ